MKGNTRRTIEYSVPEKAGELGITHAVCGVHAHRGPMLLKWQRSHQTRADILQKLATLYGGAVTGIQFIEVKGSVITFKPGAIA